MRVIRIAILECDTPIDPVKARYGTYGDRFEHLLSTELKELNLDPEIELQATKWDVVNSQVYPKLEEFDAILLTGSKHDSFADHPWIVSLTNFVHDVYHQHQKPIVGICFGHQILARALGARVGRSDAGWEVAVKNVSLNEDGKSLFSKDTLALHQLHRDVVHEVPNGCVNLGSTDRCGIHGLYQPGRVITVQGHPEFSEYAIRRVLEMRHGQKIFDDELFQDSMSRAGNAHDGRFFIQTVWKFLL